MNKLSKLYRNCSFNNDLNLKIQVLNEIKQKVENGEKLLISCKEMKEKYNISKSSEALKNDYY